MNTPACTPPAAPPAAHASPHLSQHLSPHPSPAPQPPALPQTTPARARWHSHELLGHAREVEIVHGDVVYRLRLTALGKLILTK